MKRIFCISFIVFVAGLTGFSQANELSTAELKSSYFAKRSQCLDAGSKAFSATEQAELNAILETIRLKEPESFEYYLVSYVNGNYNLDLKDHLFKAYTLNSTDETVLREMLGYYIITENLAKQKEFTGKIQKYYTAAELDYYRDAMPATSNSILVTSNQEDMYGFLAVQSADAVGTGVKIICLDFLKNSTYKGAVSTLAGISDVTFLAAETGYMKTLITGASKKVYVSTTVPQGYLSAVADNVLLTGLTYEYGAVDQRASLDRFWTRMKSRDLTKFAESVASEKKLYGNYLPPLLMLYRLRQSEGTEDVTLKTTIQTIAAKIGKKEQVDELLNQYASDE